MMKSLKDNSVDRSSIYDDQYRRLGFKAQRAYPNEELLRFFGRVFFHLPRSNRRKLRILDLGCGSGSNLWMIAKEGFNAYGMDISREGIRLCSKTLDHWGVQADLRIGSILDLPYEDNFFDSIVDVVSMQHVTYSEHIKAYSEVWRVLKPGGHFFSYHLGNRSFSYRYGGGRLIDKFTIDVISNPKAPFANNEIVCFPTEKSIEILLNDLNFRNINIENVIKTYDSRKIKIQYLVINAEK